MGTYLESFNLWLSSALVSTRLVSHAKPQAASVRQDCLRRGGSSMHKMPFAASLPRPTLPLCAEDGEGAQKLWPYPKVLTACTWFPRDKICCRRSPFVTAACRVACFGKTKKRSLVTRKPAWRFWAACLG